MIKLNTSIREFSMKLSEADFIDPFYIDLNRQLQFCMSLEDSGCALEYNSSKISAVELEFYFWAKNITGETGKGPVRTHVFTSFNQAFLPHTKRELLDSADDGVLTFFLETTNASALMTFDDILPMYSLRPDLCDCVFRVGAKTLPASKFVLSIHSEVFARMWAANMSEAKTNEVNIEDFDAETVSTMLTYLHSFGQEFSDNKVENLYRIAHKYDIFALKERCRQAMLGTTTISNGALRLIVAFECSIKEVKEEALKFVKNAGGGKLLLTSKAFEKCGETNFPLFMEILRAVVA